MSKGEDQFALQAKAVKLPVFKREYRFHPTRRWRFDFAWPEIKLAVEIEGGTWAKGRHTRGGGFEADCEKYGEAMLLGWDIYRCTTSMVSSGSAIDTVEKLINLRSD